MKASANSGSIRKKSLTGAVIALALMLLFSQGAAVYAVNTASAEKSARKSDKSKKGEEAVLLLNATATVSSFQIHFEHLCKITVNLPDTGVSVKRVFCHYTDYFNNYFLTLFQFIIATKAP